MKQYIKALTRVVHNFSNLSISNMMPFVVCAEGEHSLEEQKSYNWPQCSGVHTKKLQLIFSAWVKVQIWLFKLGHVHFQIYLKWKLTAKSHSKMRGKISKDAFIVMFVLLILVVQVGCIITNNPSTRALPFSASNVRKDSPRNTIWKSTNLHGMTMCDTIVSNVTMKVYTRRTLPNTQKLNMSKEEFPAKNVAKHLAVDNISSCTWESTLGKLTHVNIATWLLHSYRTFKDTRKSIMLTSRYRWRTIVEKMDMEFQMLRK